MMLPPRPVNVAPTDVARRPPWAQVVISDSVSLLVSSGSEKASLYQLLCIMVRQSRENLPARSAE